MDRRELMMMGAAGLTGLALPGGLQTGRGPKRVARIAHMTDMHVQPERGAQQGFEKALEAVQRKSPDMIMIGGDMVMDVLGADMARAKTQFDIFTSVVKANTSIPVHYALGNHDVWGWNNISTYEKDTYFGKQYAQERIELAKPYYSFIQAGWKFIVLDSTHRKPAGNGYTARLDEQQFEWLTSELKSTPKTMPVLVLSHIPLFCACAFLDGDNEKSGEWQVPGAWMHVDFRRIKDLFLKHPNVKVSISGHIHLVDKVEYLGVSYFCNGAVSGGWWGGKYQEFSNGYGLVELFEDGSFTNEYIEYDWTPKP